jgi:hypothetical protein
MAKTESIFAKKKRPASRTGDALAEIQERQQAAVERESESDKAQKKSERAAIRKARQFSTYIDPDLKAELRAACGLLPPSVIGGTLADLVERALRAELSRLRSEQNGGRPFETGGPDPKKGRPFKKA